MKKAITFLFVAALNMVLFAQEARKTIVDTAQNKYFVSLSVAQFADSVKAGNVLLVDVRTEKEYATEHIEGSTNVVWGNNFETLLQAANLDKGKTIAVYCRSGRRSKGAAKTLALKGYNVIELDKGIVGWQQAGLPVAK